VRPLRALGPEINTFAMVPPVALSHLHNDPEEPMPILSDHRLLRELPGEAVDAFVEASPTLRCWVAEIRHLGGALAVAAPGHGALAAIDAPYLLFGCGVAAGPEMIAALETVLPAFTAAMAPWDSGRRYLNFEERTPGSRAFFDEATYRRLARIKAQVDALDVFVSNHPVTSGP
jgi:hypothetical protein